LTAYLLADIITAYVLDLIFGDPYWLPHPVRFIGWLIKRTERFLRDRIQEQHPGGASNRSRRERQAGVMLVLFVTLVTFAIVALICKAAYMTSPVLFHAVNVYFIYTALATKCLAVEAGKVYEALEKKDIEEARKRLAMLVGRQTDGLPEREVVRGVVETTAENTVDAIISPLIYTVIGSFFGIGAPLAYAFKAISTLDSMVGYMNDRYINFGRASAKTDDAANYIPARFSGLLIPLAAMFCKKGFTKSFRIMLRDRRNHKSPNCAYPEAAVAGALGVMLGGTNVYFGQPVEKPTIGDRLKELEAGDIKDTVRIMYAASFLTLLLGAAIMGFYINFG